MMTSTQLSTMVGNTGNAAILEEVHRWVGLSLDFLQKHTPESGPSLAATPESSQGHVEHSEPVIFEADAMPVEDFHFPEWESGPTKCVFGIIGNPCTQLPAKNTPAFQSPSAYGDDSAIGLLELSHGLILGPFIDDLKILYFKNVHPYYPVIDEYEFDREYFHGVSDQVLRKSRTLVLSSMLLCSSMYLNSRQLYDSGKWTQQSLQHTLFTIAKKLYDELEDGDQYCLTQACILLSYWGPAYPPESRHVCSEWLSNAFTHAKRAGLYQATSEVMTDRSHLVWCCCIVRDRIMSFSSRQPLNPQSTPENRIRVDREDFGLELPLPRYTHSRARSRVVESFRRLCQLSEIMADIYQFESGLKKKLLEKKGEGVTRKDVLHVSSLDIQLKKWKRDFKMSLSELQVTPKLDSTGSYFLRTIFAESSTAALYIPFIHLPSNGDKFVNHFATTALRKVKDSANKVADTTKELLDTVRPEELPPFVSLWLPLSILTLLVSLKYNHRKDSGAHISSSNSSADSTPAPAPVENVDMIRLRFLFSALKIFRTRFRSGQFILDLVSQVARDLRLGLWHVDGRPVFEVVNCDAPDRVKGETETLRKAAEMIEVGILADKSGNSDR